MSGPKGAIIAGAAETDQLGRLPNHSTLQLHVEGALNAVADAGLSLRDIDGIATVSSPGPVQVAHALGITPTWIDGTGVGGTSFLLHVRHAVAAIRAGYARTVLITHGESGRSRVGATPFRLGASSLPGQFEVPYGTFGPTTTFTIPALRYMKEYGLTHEQLAYVAVAQRRWAAKNPRAAFRDPITVEDVLASRLVAYPFHLLECCLVTDGGGALVVASAERAAEFPKPAVHILGTGESSETPMISQMVDFTESQAFRRAGQAAFAEAGIGVSDVDHLMIYDAFAHVPIYGLEALGFVGKGEAGAFIADGNTEPGGSLPLNTNGGGLSYTHTGMYGMFAIQEGVRQLRGEAAAQVGDPQISVIVGNGGMFATSGVLVLGQHPAPVLNERPARVGLMRRHGSMVPEGISGPAPGSGSRAEGDEPRAEGGRAPGAREPRLGLREARPGLRGPRPGGCRGWGGGVLTPRGNQVEWATELLSSIHFGGKGGGSRNDGT